ncbi:hypothetical protein GOC38_28830 [Sinorhizobium meliloti]|nr:hypothetical protein [Sinorhizobium meliloti]MDX0321581.1 hypothetical protein [Sinorhizobium meliloti]MDX0328013.1 hypothetical protein [Sinorhizobium meliloti]
MGDRQLTNLLLGVIAAVLLFGSSAVTGALKWVFITGAVLLVLYAVFAFAAYMLREAVKALREAKAEGRDSLVVTVFGMAMMAFLPVFLSYALLLWLQGVPEPFAVVMDSWVGTTWLAILIVGGVALGLSQLYTRRADIVPTMRYGIFLLIRSPLAPFFLTIYGWQKARMAGDGVASSTASAFIGFFSGLLIWAGLLVGMLAPLFGK